MELLGLDDTFHLKGKRRRRGKNQIAFYDFKEKKKDQEEK